MKLCFISWFAICILMGVTSKKKDFTSISLGTLSKAFSKPHMHSYINFSNHRSLHKLPHSLQSIAHSIIALWEHWTQYMHWKRMRSQNKRHSREKVHIEIREIPSYHLEKHTANDFSIKQQTIFIKCVVKRFHSHTRKRESEWEQNPHPFSIRKSFIIIFTLQRKENGIAICKLMAWKRKDMCDKDKGCLELYIRMK